MLNETRKKEINLESLLNQTLEISINMNNSRSSAGIISVVDTKKNGSRLMLSKKLVNHLLLGKEVYIAITDEGLIFSNENFKNAIRFEMRDMDNRKVIYNKDLINKLKTIFNLDFQGKSIITFQKYEEINERYILVKMNKGNEGLSDVE